jgi:YD repeat-containing protein
MNDRESHGLRGAVKLCHETTIYPPVLGPDGEERPEVKQVSETEFNAAGDITLTKNHNGDGSVWLMRKIRDDSGRLRKVQSGKENEAPIEHLYEYDDRGRLMKVTDNHEPDNPSICEYDEKGRRSFVETSRPEDYKAGGAVCGSPFSIAAGAPNFPGGGSSRIFHDDQDRPYEVEVRGAKGEVVSRAFCVYDSQGRVIEERSEVENIAPALPMELQEIMIWPHNRKKLDEFLGNRKGSTVQYTYDSAGRLLKTQRSDGSSVELTYNEQGDKSSETARPADASGSHFAWPPYSEAHFDYVYDDKGNWTEERTSYRSTPDGALQHSGTRRRELTYF